MTSAREVVYLDACSRRAFTTHRTLAVSISDNLAAKW
jgi:hypothetical protein